MATACLVSEGTVSMEDVRSNTFCHERCSDEECVIVVYGADEACSLSLVRV